MAATSNASGRFSADVGYTKRPKKPKLPLAGEPRKMADESKRKAKPKKKR